MSPRQRLSAGTSRQPKHRQPFLRNASASISSHCRRTAGSWGRNTMATPYAGGGQGEAQAIGLGGEELMRHLHQDAGPVAGRFVGPRRPAASGSTAPACHTRRSHARAARDIDTRPRCRRRHAPTGIVETSGFGRRTCSAFFVDLRGRQQHRTGRNRPRGVLSMNSSLPWNRRDVHFYRIISFPNVNGTLELGSVAGICRVGRMQRAPPTTIRPFLVGFADQRFASVPVDLPDIFHLPWRKNCR